MDAVPFHCQLLSFGTELCLLLSNTVASSGSWADFCLVPSNFELLSSPTCLEDALWQLCSSPGGGGTYGVALFAFLSACFNQYNECLAFLGGGQRCPWHALWSVVPVCFAYSFLPLLWCERRNVHVLFAALQAASWLLTWRKVDAVPSGMWLLGYRQHIFIVKLESSGLGGWQECSKPCLLDSFGIL